MWESLNANLLLFSFYFWINLPNKFSAPSSPMENSCFIILDIISMIEIYVISFNGDKVKCVFSFLFFSLRVGQPCRKKDLFSLWAKVNPWKYLNIGVCIYTCSGSLTSSAKNFILVVFLPALYYLFLHGYFVFLYFISKKNCFQRISPTLTSLYNNWFHDGISKFKITTHCFYLWLV